MPNSTSKSLDPTATTSLSDGIITAINPEPDTIASQQQQLRIFEGITSTTPDFVYAFDLQGRFIYANRRLLEVWGIKLSDAVGKTCRELGYEQWHHDMHMREIAQVIGTKKPIKGEVPFKAALTGIFGVYEYIFTPVIGEDGKVELIAGTTRDVTDRKNAESALAKAQQELKLHAENLEGLVADRTTKLRDTIAELETLSYSISHDVRAPLRAMQGFSQALLEDYKTKLDDEGVSYLERISSASVRLDSLIHDILLYTKVARDRLVLSPIALEPLIHEILETYHPDQISKISIIPPFPSVLGHPAFLSQIISNLVTNALKFVWKGQDPEVLIRSELQGEFVKLWVEDQGVGIEPQHLDRIFQVFGRVYSDSEYPGTGIGLAIVKRAVQRMGGEAGVESIAGQGSRFWITLKAAPVSPA